MDHKKKLTLPMKGEEEKVTALKKIKSRGNLQKVNIIRVQCLQFNFRAELPFDLFWGKREYLFCRL